MGTDADVGATKRSVEILETIRTLEQPRLTDVATHLDLPYSTVHNHLQTLEALDLVGREGNTYRIGLRFLEYGEYCKRDRPVYRAGVAEIDDLAMRTQELSSLMTLENGYGVYLACTKGEKAIPFDPDPGTRTYCNQTALGKSMLAALDPDAVDTIIDRHGLPAQTERTLTSVEDLYRDLEATRDRGYAIDDQEYTAGCRCLAVAITDPDDDVVGAISVSGPDRRMRSQESTVVEALSSARNTIELRLASMLDT